MAGGDVTHLEAYWRVLGTFFANTCHQFRTVDCSSKTRLNALVLGVWLCILTCKKRQKAYLEHIGNHLEQPINDRKWLLGSAFSILNLYIYTYRPKSMDVQPNQSLCKELNIQENNADTDGSCADAWIGLCHRCSYIPKVLFSCDATRLCVRASVQTYV